MEMILGQGKKCKKEICCCVSWSKGTYILNVLNLILHDHLRNGINNACENHEDVINPGHKYSKGVYITPLVDITEKYTKEVSISQLKKKYRIAFQCRVNPNKIRQSTKYPEFWILEGNGQEIRPYRVLIKE